MGDRRGDRCKQRSCIRQTTRNLLVIASSSRIVARPLNPNFPLIDTVVATGNGLVDMWEASPVRLDSNAPRTDEIIDILFPGNPLLCCGWNRHHFDTRPLNHWYKLDDL